MRLWLWTLLPKEYLIPSKQTGCFMFSSITGSKPHEQQKSQSLAIRARKTQTAMKPRGETDWTRLELYAKAKSLMHTGWSVLQWNGTWPLPAHNTTTLPVPEERQITNRISLISIVCPILQLDQCLGICTDMLRQHVLQSKVNMNKIKPFFPRQQSSVL